MVTTDKLECGHPESPHSAITRGYGTDSDGRRACYICCAEQDRAYMVEHGRWIGYLVDSPTGWIITNWPGSLVIHVAAVKRGRHNIAGSRMDAWFAGPDAKPWHGTQYGNFGQIIHCKRTA